MMDTKSVLLGKIKMKIIYFGAVLSHRGWKENRMYTFQFYCKECVGGQSSHFPTFYLSLHLFIYLITYLFLLFPPITNNY